MQHPFLEPARHLYRYLARPNYREFVQLRGRLGKISRFTEGQVRIGKFDLRFPDAASVLSAYEAIFFQQIYKFESNSSSPSILDLGANIGLSIFYFKSLYPDAKITAFEADPKIFSFLKRNVEANGLKGVTLLNQAAWDRNEKLSFFAEGADGGRIDQNELSDRKIEVQAIDLREFLSERSFEFVKMDIEGAEERVLPAIGQSLDKTRFIFVEYHSRADHPQKLHELLGLMTNAGFRVYVRDEPATWSSSPFVERRLNCGFDLQLNLFGYRR